MTNDKESTSFEPVLLDLSDNKDYITVVQALEDYAAAQDSQAEAEQDRIRYNDLPESQSEEAYWRELAARARRIVDDVERQIDANSAARRSIGKAGE